MELPTFPNPFFVKNLCLDWESLTLEKAIDICHMNKMAASQRVKMEETDMFILSTVTKPMLALRIHIRILERSKTANIAETPTRLETTQPLAKHVPNVTKKSSCKSLSLHHETQ